LSSIENIIKSPKKVERIYKRTLIIVVISQFFGGAGLATGITVGATVLLLSHIVMVAIMTMMPIHMQDHGAGLTAVGLVIGLHIAAKYLLSILTGRLVDKIGRNKLVVASGVTLAVSGLMAAFVPGESLFWMAFALILLGIGWNFRLISGTAIVIGYSSYIFLGFLGMYLSFLELIAMSRTACGSWIGKEG